MNVKQEIELTIRAAQIAKTVLQLVGIHQLSLAKAMQHEIVEGLLDLEGFFDEIEKEEEPHEQD